MAKDTSKPKNRDKKRRLKRESKLDKAVKAKNERNKEALLSKEKQSDDSVLNGNVSGNDAQIPQSDPLNAEDTESINAQMQITKNTGDDAKKEKKKKTKEKKNYKPARKTRKELKMEKAMKEKKERNSRIAQGDAEKEESEKKKKKKKKVRKERKRISPEKIALGKRIITGVLIGLALVYAIFLFVTTNFMGNNNYMTEMVSKTMVSNTIKTSAFIARDEAVLENTTNGILVYTKNNGDRVRKDGVIATAYQNEQDAINQQKVQEIDEKIAYLQSLSDASTSVNIGVDTVNAQLTSRFVNLLDSINKRNLTGISTVESDLMSLIYRKQIVTGEQGSFQDMINSLEGQKNKLESSTTSSLGEVVSGYAGYFVHNLDGYENIFPISDLDRITYDDFKNIKPKEVDNDKYVGKIIKSVNWYIICPISKDDQILLSHNNGDIYVNLPYASSEMMQAKIVYTNENEEDEDHIMLVLSCNYMNSSISEIRNESVDIVVNSYEGLKIPKKALHDDYCTRTTYNEDGTSSSVKERTQGVYVEYGNELKFKPVYIIYSDDDYVICDENPSSEHAYDRKTVSLYDKVVVEGSDLFDGKLLD